MVKCKTILIIKYLINLSCGLFGFNMKLENIIPTKSEISMFKDQYLMTTLFTWETLGIVWDESQLVTAACYQGYSGTSSLINVYVYAWPSGVHVDNTQPNNVNPRIVTGAYYDLLYERSYVIFWKPIYRENN